MKPKLLVFIIMLLLTLLIGFGPAKDLKGKLFFHSGYYFIFASTLMWSIYLLRLHRLSIVRHLRTHWIGLLLSFSLVTAIFIIAPPQYKILNDEALLTGVSLSFHNHKKANVTTHGIFNETLLPQYSLRELDKRPLLYPLGLSIIHAMIGYRAENAFIFNYLCAVLILFIAYVLIFQHFNREMAVAAVILTASTPAFVFWITSAGFETLTLLMLQITFLLFYIFLKQKTVEHAELLLLTFILLSQCRYESILFAIILVSFMAPFIYKNISSRKWSYAVCLSPFLMLPVIWQRVIFLHPPESFVKGELGTKTGFFGWDNLVNHFSTNIYVFMGLDPDLGFTPVMALLGLIGFYLFIKKRIVNNTVLPSEEKQLFWASLISLLAFSGLVFSHHFGDFSNPILHRISLLYLPFFTFFAIYGLNALKQKINQKQIYLVPMFLICMLILYWPYGARQNLLRYLTIKIEYASTLDYLKAGFPNRSNTLIFGDRTNLYMINGFKSEDIRWLNANQDFFWSEVWPAFDNILLIQRYLYGENQPLPTSQTAQSFNLKKLKTIKLQKYYLVISKLWRPDLQP